MAWTIFSLFVLFCITGSINAIPKVPKIIGGEKAYIKEFPYIVSLRELGFHFCAGSIISDRHIITAGHCLDSFNKDIVRVHAGTSYTDKRGTSHKIKSAHVHPKFDTNDDEGGYPHDIAILTLEKPIVFNKYTQKINLPSHEVKDFEVGYVIGWGRYSRSDWEASEQLQKLKVVLVPSDRCKNLIKHKMNPEQVCSFRSDSSGSCHGDSGGPLVANGEIVGLVSYGDEGDCADGIPDIYTMVYAYKDFIESVMNETNVHSFKKY